MTRRLKQHALPTRRSSRIRIRDRRFPDIPFELIFGIASNVADQQTLLAFRLVNRALSRFITPLAFSTVHAYPSTVSATHLVSLQNNPLAVHVRELVFQECEDSAGNNFTFWFSVDEGSLDEFQSYHGTQTEDALRKTFSSLAKFPSLTILRLEFHDFIHDPFGSWNSHSCLDCRFSYHMQHSILQTITSNPPPASLKSLFCRNILSDDTWLSSDPQDFKAFISVPSEFDISIVSVPLRIDVDLTQAEEFWSLHLLESVLLPARNTLAKLYLGSIRETSDTDLPIRLKGLLIPNLTDLTLTNLIFRNASVDDFILRHRKTLQSLVLDRCLIYVYNPKTLGPRSASQRRWHHVLKRLEQMTGLIRFEGRELAYVKRSGERDVYSLDDEIAMGNLMRVVRSRRV